MLHHAHAAQAGIGGGGNFQGGGSLCADVTCPPPNNECDDRIAIGDAPPFAIKHDEAHLPDLYARFPEHRQAIDEYLPRKLAQRDRFLP